jgi:hypothetical protein
VPPDLIELVNEPNLKRFKADQWAELLKDTEVSLGNQSVNLAGPATATHLPVGVDFVQAAQANGSLGALKAITVHTYYVRDKPNNDGIPPANDPALQTLFKTAKSMGVPVISSEFGGTNLKTKYTDPGRNSVNASEEFKAALDLITAGESAAFVWNLYPNNKRGSLLKTWALIDERGPTNAYWPFYILAPKIPVGSDVLAVEKTDISPTMTSLGYAGFRNGHNIYVGLSNPGPVPVTVDLALSGVQNYTVVHAAGFLPDRSVVQDGSVNPGHCSLNVMIPSETGTVLDLVTQ